MEKKLLQNGKLAAGGMAIGLANGLFGGGGGMVAVPILEKVGLKEKSAHATAILVILPVSLLSLILYFWKGAYDFSLLIPTSLGVTAGGALGAKLLGKMPVKAVNLAFAALQALAGLFMFFS